MLLDFIAIGAAAIASFTGIAAIGCRQRFHYSRAQLAAFDPLAVAYVWTAVSTVASGFYATSLLDATVRGGGQYNALALTASVVCSVLFAVAHVAIGHWADRRKNGARAS